MSTPTVLITGATAGFGKAMAEKFSAGGYTVIIAGRRADKLATLKEELEMAFGNAVHTLCFDVRRHSAVNEAFVSLAQYTNYIDILINNAGLAAGLEMFGEASMDDWEQMIDTNVKGLLYVTRAALPYLRKSNNPYIFNIGSTAGRYVYEKGTVYNASKFAVDALSQGMRIDLLKENMRVTLIEPGAAETEFSLVRFKGDAEKARKVYEGYEPLHAADIADAVWYCAHTPKHVCINELMITPTAQANPFYVNRRLS
jgi:NADP-dependent 3-hydroxy acid dehydrogenase YdfG